jgi:hypothetical protein
MKTSADPATRISPDAGREKTPGPVRSACCAIAQPSSLVTVPEEWAYTLRIWMSTP